MASCEGSVGYWPDIIFILGIQNLLVGLALKCTASGFYLENFFWGGSVEYVWEGPTRSAKILRRVHGEV